MLVNNAGITKDGLILRMDDEDFDTVIATNLKSAFVAIRAAARPMMRAKSGRIINISSVSGVAGNAGQANYAASKAGLIGLSKSVAKELAGKNITCNVVAPGFITTDMTDVLNDQIKETRQGLHSAQAVRRSRRKSPQWSVFWPARMPVMSPVRCCAWMAAWSCE